MAESIEIKKQTGSTNAERYLVRLCENSFLSLWSYPSIFRDQGKVGSGDGKEICDLIVVFGNEVIIFSDKDCHFPNTGTIDLDWSRWFSRAIKKSAEQVWGAERWITKNPERVFVDRQCMKHLPVLASDLAQLEVHRVVVAHGVIERCQELLGGSGSLMIFPTLIGDAHVKGPVVFEEFEKDIYEMWEKMFQDRNGYSKTVLPFAIGDLNPNKGFVHVFDDVGIDLVLRELDTVSDFLSYLKEREQFIRSNRLFLASGEDDLLAHYLTEYEGYCLKSFPISEHPNGKIAIPEGAWWDLQNDKRWIGRKHENEVSYAWDRLIEIFNKCIMDGTSPAYKFADFSNQEMAVRAMASEPRYHRRLLATALTDFLKSNQDAAIVVRVVGPIQEGSPYYIFLTVRPDENEGYQQYRERRWAIGKAYLIETRNKFSDAEEVILIATELPEHAKWLTEDVMYLGVEPLSSEEIDEVQEFVKTQGILSKLSKRYETKPLEFPDFCE